LTNYTITGPGNGYPTYNPDTAAFGADHSKVLLHFDKETAYNTQHTVFCQNLHDVYDNALDTNYDEAVFVGVGVKPGLVDFDGSPGSYVINEVSILLQFTEALREFGNYGYYFVYEWPSGTPVEVVSATQTTSTTVTVIVNWETPLYTSEYYTVVVGNDFVCDLAGNFVDPLLDTILLPGAPPP
jgi:hypothetical protein